MGTLHHQLTRRWSLIYTWDSLVISPHWRKKTQRLSLRETILKKTASRKSRPKPGTERWESFLVYLRKSSPLMAELFSLVKYSNIYHMYIYIYDPRVLHSFSRCIGDYIFLVYTILYPWYLLPSSFLDPRSYTKILLSFFEELLAPVVNGQVGEAEVAADIVAFPGEVVTVIFRLERGKGLVTICDKEMTSKWHLN